MNRDIYRPLRMVHDDFGYRKEDSLETKCRCIRERIAGLKAKGFGGIVTNVAHDSTETKKLCWKGQPERIMDPFTDEAIPVSACSDGIRFELAGYSAALLYTE